MTPAEAARPLTILIAPDSFKGSLTSVQVARALADGWGRARPADTLLLCPLADGGEGTLEAVAAAGGWTWQESFVTDPLGRKIRARWLRSVDGHRAYIEMAEASGLSRVAAAERDPIAATSVGTGELIRAAIDVGVESIVLGIGGSATTDGGAGLLGGLGGDVDRDRAVANVSGLDPRLGAVELAVACDVSNPLLGPSGAAAVYGPQKGATPAHVADLDDRLRAYADALEAACGCRVREVPGAGAAGGIGFGLLAIADRFRSFTLQPGIDLVMAATDFDARLAAADLVITGEGRIDAQTAFGKTALGVAKRAAEAGVPSIAVGGGVEPSGIGALAAVGCVAVPVVERPQSVEEAMAAGIGPLERCGERLARLISLDLKGRFPGTTRSSSTRTSRTRCRSGNPTTCTPRIRCASSFREGPGGEWRPIRPDARGPGTGRGPADPDGRSSHLALRRRDDLVIPQTPQPTARRRPRPKKRKFTDPGRSYAKRLERYRPGLVPFVLDGLASIYGHPAWERRLDPTSELILTILTQNSADTNAEVAFEALRQAYPGDGPVEVHNPGAGWGGFGLPPGAAPDWAAVEFAPLPELTAVIRPGGLENQKAPRIQATLSRIREERGDYSLEFLDEMSALEARDWLTQINGIGRKTASVLLLFCFGQPLLPIDRHVDRVLRRVGVLPPKPSLEEAHDLVLGLFEPDQMYEAHVNLIQHGRKICHAQRPEHDKCPLITRCRFVDPKAR